MKTRPKNKKWELTDNDCYQHMCRADENVYRMVEIVWLDTTPIEEAKGMVPWIVVAGGVDISDLSAEDIQMCLSAYGYETSDDPWMIAECWMEEDILNHDNIIGEFKTQEEAEAFVLGWIENN